MDRLCVNGRIWTVLTVNGDIVVVHSIGLQMTRSVDRGELEERDEVAVR